MESRNESSESSYQDSPLATKPSDPVTNNSSWTAWLQKAGYVVIVVLTIWALLSWGGPLINGISDPTIARGLITLIITIFTVGIAAGQSHEELISH